jgi:hypothetical protein
MPVPAERSDAVQPVGFSQVRTWGDERLPFA